MKLIPLGWVVSRLEISRIQVLYAFRDLSFGPDDVVLSMGWLFIKEVLDKDLMMKRFDNEPFQRAMRGDRREWLRIIIKTKKLRFGFIGIGPICHFAARFLSAEHKSLDGRDNARQHLVNKAVAKGFLLKKF